MNVAISSLFSQLLSLVDRNGFAKLVRETGSGRRSTGFASRDHFVAMLFCQIAQARSLREINGGLSSCEGKLRHLGMDGAPGRSTLSYANTHRPAELFEKLFYQVLGNVSRLKKNALWTSHEARPVKPGGKVRRDTEGRFFDFDASRRIETRFRRVTVWIEEKGEEMELLTNRFDLSAETIAGIYRQRWQIELFFKAIKQNLRT